MSTHPLLYFRRHLFTTDFPERRFTLCGYLALSLLLHLAVYSVFTALTMNVEQARSEIAVIEIDLTRIEAASPKKISSPPTPLSNPRTATQIFSPSTNRSHRTAHPVPEKSARKRAGFPPLVALPGKATFIKSAELKTAGSLPREKEAVSTFGVHEMSSGNGREENNDRPAGDGQQENIALAEYSRTIRALIEKHKAYPHAARKMGLHGSVIVSFSLDCHGKVRQVSLEKTSGNSMLDNAGIRAVHDVGTFPPPPHHALTGELISFRIPITFTLTSG